MQLITAPENFTGQGTGLKLFLAGGIVNCPDWQKEILAMLFSTNLIIFNPRRDFYPLDNPDLATEQITWEHKWLNKCDLISFWFSEGSINPIVLYELGRWGNSGNKHIFIGIHPEYKRKQDVLIQTKLDRLDIEIVSSLEDLGAKIKNYAFLG